MMRPGGFPPGLCDLVGRDQRSPALPSLAEQSQAGETGQFVVSAVSIAENTPANEAATSE
jgi:hypothetical protein